MSTHDYNVRSRGYLRFRATKLCTKVQDSLQEFSPGEKLATLNNLESLKNELKTLDNAICAQMWENECDENALHAEWEASYAYEQKIIGKIAVLKQDVTQSPVTVGTNETEASEFRFIESFAPRLNKLKLPEIPLPTYENAPDETLTNFLENFEGIITKYSLSDYEKFVYLQRQLSGEPLTLVGSLSGARPVYSEAKALLKEAFADCYAEVCCNQTTGRVKAN